ncbi:MAG: hypothetical protein IKZ87_04615 [Actinomycetaceae bacterium]|nr:hypothetical protein [Actinomycetaceae bacterium]
MKLEIFDALSSINVDKGQAKAVANAIEAAIEKRCTTRELQLATKADIAETKKEIIRWMVAVVACATLFLSAVCFALS